MYVAFYFTFYFIFVWNPAVRLLHTINQCGDDDDDDDDEFTIFRVP